jgi:hypothetical protein
LRSGGGFNETICDGLITDASFSCRFPTPDAVSVIDVNFEFTGKMTKNCIQLQGIQKGYSKNDLRHETEIGILLSNIR